MAGSLKNVAFSLTAPDLGPWRLKTQLPSLWPPLTSRKSGVSVLEVVRRLAPAGAVLRTFASETSSAWPTMHRSTVVDGLRERLRDPAVMRQRQTDFCGPLAIMMELARRSPTHYVDGVVRLFSRGGLPVFDGSTIDAEEDLRGRPLPAATQAQGAIAEVDWIVAATLRDDENLTDDVDDGRGNEGSTLPGAMERWVRDVLGLRSELATCYSSGELEALQVARRAVQAGGVAFLFIDANLLKNGTGDTESDMYWSSRSHRAGQPVSAFGPRTHSKDDATFLGFFGDHWVIYLGELTPEDPASHDQLSLKVWSWGQEFTVTGLAEDFGEYLYAVVAGWP